MNKTFLVGDKVTYTYNDFDGSGVLEGVITEVSEDHAIAEIDGMTMYIDESNEENFTVKTTVKELKAMAKELHISNWWNLTKGVLIEKIKEAQNLSDEEKQAIADQKAKEDAALAAYNKDWRKYTKRFNPVEFMEKFRSGEIVLEDDEETEVEEPIAEEENLETETIETETTKESNDEKIAKKNIENAYNWIVGGNENSVNDGEMTEEEFNDWITNDAFDEILDEAMSSEYGDDHAGGKAPSAMKRVRKSICKQYLLSLFKEDGHEISVEIKEKEGHKPTEKHGALLEFDGRKQNICAWGKELGISPNTLYGRIYKLGWPIEKAFTTPGRKK